MLKFYKSIFFPIALAACFATWMYIVPGIVGVILLLMYFFDGRKKLLAEQTAKEAEIQKLKNEIEELGTPEYHDLVFLRDEIEKANGKISDCNNTLEKAKKELSDIQTQISNEQKKLVQIKDEQTFQTYGIYNPTFKFLTVDEYKEKLYTLRKQQKDLISNHNAVTGSATWTVNGNAAQGKKMVSDTQKLLLRAFNGECDDLVEKVKYNNLEASIDRINKSCDTISNLGKIMSISITDTYRKLKIEELKIAYEFAQAKQKEKETQKALREQMREEAKLQKEIEEQRQKIRKEQTHYSNALAKAKQLLEKNPDDVELQNKVAELTLQYEETEKALTDIDYRAANAKAGYVYVISNIGAFGENVYKIGMTRRLDPQDRIDELGDASVPFNFDVHAMIFTEDAPALEAALHKAFENKKLNLINPRREFFNVSLDEIKQVVRANYDKTVEFVDVPDAEQYHMSEQLRVKK